MNYGVEIFGDRWSLLIMRVVARLHRSPWQVDKEVKALVRNRGCIFPEIRNLATRMALSKPPGRLLLPTPSHEDGVVTCQGFTNR